MTELDIYNAMIQANEQASTVGEMLLTVLTGYLLIAFFVGKQLTNFQVSFVNIVFVLTYLSMWQSTTDYLAAAIHFRDSLTSMNSELPLLETVAGATPTVNWLVGGLLTIGALYFMWSVRHPKTE